MQTQTTHPATLQEITNQPAVYVGTYGKYNNGSIYGKWIDLTFIEDEADFLALCEEIHADEEDAEFMFQDWQSVPSRFISESGFSSEFWDYLDALKNCDKPEALEAFISYGYEAEYFEEAFMGEYGSEEDFATELLDNTGELDQIPQNLRYYFDYEMYARDLFINDFTYIDGFVFRNI